MAKKKSKSKMTYKEKVAQAMEILQNNGYSEEEIAEIIKLSFGSPPKSK